MSDAVAEGTSRPYLHTAHAPGYGIAIRRSVFLAGAAALLGAAPAADPLLRFQLHATFYSKQLQIEPAVDPQVFVGDPTVSIGGIGLEGIEHVAGLRALRLSDANVPLFTAEGAHMGFTSTKWLAATGSASLAPFDDGAVRVKLDFVNLVVFGAYSVLKRFAGASGDVFLPLDGAGDKNGFVADDAGHASLAIRSPQPLGETGALLLVYHSNGKPQAQRSGSIGVTSHDHLIAPFGAITSS